MRILKWAIPYMILGLVFFCHTTGLAQKTTNDSIASESPTHSELKASIYSAVVPGMGQVYNRKIWKLPIIYAGIGSLGYFAYDNHQEFLRFRKAYFDRQDDLGDEFEGILSDDALINEMDRFRRYRDLNLIAAFLVYVLQILDANVDASLYDFDVSDDLSLKIAPLPVQRRTAMGVGIQLNF